MRFILVLALWIRVVAGNATLAGQSTASDVSSNSATSRSQKVERETSVVPRSEKQTGNKKSHGNDTERHGNGTATDGGDDDMFNGLDHYQNFDKLPESFWGWSRIEGPPETDSTSKGFTGIKCTQGFVHPVDQKRAERHIEHVCSRWIMEKERLYASISSSAVLYMCSFKGERNCSIGLWREAMAALDRSCGSSGTGWLELNKLRFGRETPEDQSLCERINYTPLWNFRLRQRTAVLVDGLPWLPWISLERIRRLMSFGEPDQTTASDITP